MPHDNIGPSTAHQPDLNWSQVRETILMLGVSIGQIEHAMSDGHDSVKTLAESFANMHNELKGTPGGAKACHRKYWQRRRYRKLSATDGSGAQQPTRRSSPSSSTTG